LVLLASCSTSLAVELLVPTQYPTIQSAIDAAVDGDTVIVAQGTYIGPGNRDIDFLGKAITVRSTDPNDPNIVDATIINCNGTKTEPHRGFYFHSGEGLQSVLAGLKIINGYADAGGGILCEYSSSPTIIDCNMTGNSAGFGGGICCVYNSNPAITNCNIISNSARMRNGGGIGGCGGPITNCNITNNLAREGGGLDNCYGPITYCTITGNSASHGGGLANCRGYMTNCTISNNFAEYGGGGIYYGYSVIVSSIVSSIVITNCTIMNNSTKYYGGGIYCSISNLMIIDCDITGNSADEGGGIYCSSNSPIINNCTITDNYGGGIYGCAGPITNCTITYNSTNHLGGGLYECSGPITNCTISGNSTGEGGGLTFCDGPIKNCIITGNSTMYGGGLYYCRGLITNCTITDNSAKHGAGLFACIGPVKNCIIWGNWPDQIQIYHGFPKATYSNIQGSYPGLGNNNADPCFIEPGYWFDVNDPNIIVEPNDPNAVWLDGDYHLLPASPCINAGDPNYVPEPNETDLDGLPRIIGGRVDMGPYEFNHQPIAIAGPNQTVYAWFDGFADVNLDGSASYDDDNDLLDYYWSWTIGGDTHEANGVNPTIKLPVGIHTIELVVDDGINLSEPDYCTITVIKAVRGRLILSPNVLQSKSCGKWLIATLFIPPVPGEKVNTTVPLRLYPSGIEAKYQRFYRYGFSRFSPMFAVAFFDKQQVIDALGTGNFDVSVVGQFLSGRFFFGSDSIKITTPKPPPKPWHW
jgi:hypothetical protein